MNDTLKRYGGIALTLIGSYFIYDTLNTPPLEPSALELIDTYKAKIDSLEATLR